MSLPVTVAFKPSKTVYVVLMSDDGSVWNPTSKAFESLEDGTNCRTGIANAIELLEEDCLPGVYRGVINLNQKGKFTILAWEATQTEIDLQMDELIGSTEVDHSTTEEVTETDLRDLLLELQETVDTVDEGGSLRNLIEKIHTYTRQVYQRKSNNRPF